jgi:hypothetical protein
MKNETKKSIKLPLVMRDISNKLDRILDGINLLVERNAINKPQWTPSAYSPSSRATRVSDLEALAFTPKVGEVKPQQNPVKDPLLGSL